ncbi:LacI family transcriptional regulator [Actinoplanes sp. SE50]|uniref:LacI family DNA-binding transcriptional regulator n=1 Tax=unclassified Actinoplanes TaxID=2626549 RepID=UPI00023EBFA0|nr:MULTISPECIES: LacI family DNA-binding transcriptional regulator [unclassified Actinoplanes]AEV86926.1 PurR-like HTH-type transcriptional repressor [Actinoplanes sp. SE50/110]ATO85322.1 LacI family transcriptional regulator [Actinoplanes sp. SE50]SLM02733.1 LacI family transcriptional regulator [Actinoplanes sp. SE50/110]
MATIYDVAQRARVSPATVSRVLNGNDSVDPGLADRVRDAVRELNYRPNMVARNLRRSRTTLWAVIISDVENPFFTALVRGVEDVAQRAGYSVVLCNSDEDPAKEARYVTAALEDRMAGVIISSAGSTANVTRLIEAGTPVVAIDRQIGGTRVDSVLVDNEHGAEAATAHLIGNGYRRIACITGPAAVSTAVQRLRGYRRALQTHKIKIDDALVRHADFREDGGYTAMASLLDAGEPPDAVFTANNLMTVGAVECLVDRGVAIPAGLGVIGFDEAPGARLLRPALSTVAQPTYELGRTAATLLAERIADPDRPPSTVTLLTELRIRESSRGQATVQAAPLRVTSTGRGSAPVDVPLKPKLSDAPGAGTPW